MIYHSKPLIEDIDVKSVSNLLRKGDIAKGKLNLLLSDKIENYIGSNKIILTSSGAVAIQRSLLLAGVKSGDEVIIPSYVCESVFYALVSLNIKPVLCDIGKNWVVNKSNIKSKQTRNTKAIILVHTFGIAVDVDNFLDLDLVIIEDCSQAFGLKIKGKTAGTIGDIGVFSFQATKCLTTGEGGAISINKEEFIEKYKEEKKVDSYFTGMTDLQCALGLSQLNRYDSFLSLRKEIANAYMEVLMKYSITFNIRNSIYFRFPLKVENDTTFIKFFKKKGIIVRKGVDAILHKSQNVGGVLQETEKTFKQTVSLPIYPAMKRKEITLVTNTLNEWYENEY